MYYVLAHPKCKQIITWKGSMHGFFNMKIRSMLYLQYSQCDKKKKLPDAIECYNHCTSSDSFFDQIFNAFEFLLLSNVL